MVTLGFVTGFCGESVRCGFGGGSGWTKRRPWFTAKIYRELSILLLLLFLVEADGRFRGEAILILWGISGFVRMALAFSSTTAFCGSACDHFAHVDVESCCCTETFSLRFVVVTMEDFVETMATG